MFKASRKVVSAVVALMLLAVAAASVYAAPVRQMTVCERDHTVQADDWLSKLSDKYYGDILAYPAIVEATNAAAQSDSSYAAIANPDLIEIGWTLCIPSGTDAQAMMDKMMGDEMMAEEMTGEEMMAEEMTDEEMMSEEMMGESTSFTVRIENVGNAAQSALTTPFAPGVWVVHTAADPLFSAGQADRDQGLEALAEDGDPSGLAAAVAGQSGVSASGAFNTPVGATEPGPLLPGEAYEFTFEALAGDNLSFATMFVQSNDLFFAPDGAGIALFEDDGTPITGDVTGLVALWDAGTEVNQEPGVGADQAPRQAGPDTGEDENGVVQIVSDEFTYPGTSETIQVSITAVQSMQN